MNHESSQNATPTPAQERVIAELLRGQTITQASAAGEVARETVHRWMREDFTFQAAYNAGRRELRDAMQARLVRMAQRATEVVEKAIEDGDAKAAMDVLKGMGLLTGKPESIGSGNPDELARNGKHSSKLQEMWDAAFG